MFMQMEGQVYTWKDQGYTRNTTYKIIEKWNKTDP